MFYFPVVLLKIKYFKNFFLCRQKHRLPEPAIELCCWGGCKRSFGKVSSPEYLKLRIKLSFAITWRLSHPLLYLTDLRCTTLLLTGIASASSPWWELELRSMTWIWQAAALCTTLLLHWALVGETIFTVNVMFSSTYTLRTTFWWLFFNNNPDVFKWVV